MKRLLTASEKMMALSVAFTLFLVTFRIIYTGELNYGFYYWNTFLALIPLFLSKHLLRQKEFRLKSCMLLIGWLLFYPNAPYIITDLFHYTKSDEFPAWVDLVLVTTGTWNGLLLGLISLMQVELFLTRFMQKKWVVFSVILCILLCGYGIYLGRYLRFNSWDIVTNPSQLLYASADHILQPLQHLKAWSFTLLFSFMYSLFYFTLKHLRPTEETIGN